MVLEAIFGITAKLISLLVPELFLLLFVKKSGNGFKIKGITIDKFPNLQPYANMWLIGAITLSTYLFVPDIYEAILGKSIELWLVSLGLVKTSILAISLLGFNLIFLVNHIFRKKIDGYSTVLGITSLVFFILFVVLVVKTPI